MHIIGKHFSYRFQQNLNESYMMIGSKVSLTTEYNNIDIKMKNI
jgi:hypothetical protein